MIEHHLDIPTPAGAMNSFIVHPDGGGPRPVVLYLMDAPGKREELHNMARRVASAGYFTILSNLYYREVREYNVFESGDRDRMFALMNNVSNSQAVDDCRSMLDFAAAQSTYADCSRVGVVGYCMSGPFALMAAAAIPAVKAAASFHGVALVKDSTDSPHRNLAATAELYVGAAEQDEWAPPEMVNGYRNAAEAAGVNATVEWYPGTHHGFTFAERPMYDKPSSERHWSRLHDLLRRNLFT